MEPFLLLAAFAVVAVGAAWWAHEQEQKRRARWQAFAASRGWSYVARDDRLCDRFVGTPFGEGEDRQARHVVRGEFEGHPAVAFDYSWVTESTDSKGNRQRTTHRAAVTALELPCWLPTLELSPENLLTRIGGALGLDDIELESEDFNRRYRVSARDPKFAYDVLHPRTMELLLARDTTNLRLRDAACVAWGSGRGTPVDVLARLSTSSAVVRGIPSYVWSDHAHHGGASA